LKILNLSLLPTLAFLQPMPVDITLRKKVYCRAENSR